MSLVNYMLRDLDQRRKDAEGSAAGLKLFPDKIDLENRKLEWRIDSLNKDETRIFTYIIYSKIGIVGRFELPETKAIYEQDGQIKEASSNRSFYVNEPNE